MGTHAQSQSSDIFTDVPLGMVVITEKFVLGPDRKFKLAETYFVTVCASENKHEKATTRIKRKRFIRLMRVDFKLVFKLFLKIQNFKLGYGKIVFI